MNATEVGLAMQNRLHPELDKIHSTTIAAQDNSYHSYQIEQCIIQCRQITCARLEKFLGDFLLLALESLEDAIDRAKSNRKVVEANDNLREFRIKKNSIKIKFYEKINQGFDLFLKKELHIDLCEADRNNFTLSLVEEEDLEESLALKTIVNNSNREFQDCLWQLEKRFEAIQNTLVSQHSNPISPMQFCNALQKSLENTTLCNSSILILYKTFESNFSDFLQSLYRSINVYLIKQNILPSLKKEYSVSDSDLKNKTLNNPISHYNNSEEQAEIDLVDGKKCDKKQVNLINLIKGLLKTSRIIDHPYKSIESFVTSDLSPETIRLVENRTDNYSTLFSSQEIIHAISIVQAEEAKNILISNRSIIDQGFVLNTKKKIANVLEKKSKRGGIHTKYLYAINLVGILLGFG